VIDEVMGVRVPPSAPFLLWGKIKTLTAIQSSKIIGVRCDIVLGRILLTGVLLG
jgi:hypothetical protein